MHARDKTPIATNVVDTAVTDAESGLSAAAELAFRTHIIEIAQALGRFTAGQAKDDLLPEDVDDTSKVIQELFENRYLENIPEISNLFVFLEQIRDAEARTDHEGGAHLINTLESILEPIRFNPDFTHNDDALFAEVMFHIITDLEQQLNYSATLNGITPEHDPGENISYMTMSAEDIAEIMSSHDAGGTSWSLRYLQVRNAKRGA